MNKFNKWKNRYLFRLTASFIIVFSFGILFSVLLNYFTKKVDLSCIKIDFKDSSKQTLVVDFRQADQVCYTLIGNIGQAIQGVSSERITILTPKKEKINTAGTFTQPLLDTGEYFIYINKSSDGNYSKLEISLSSNNIGNSTPPIDTKSFIPQNKSAESPATIPIPSPPIHSRRQATYNVLSEPPLKNDPAIQEIVNKISELASQRGLPKSSLSISLIDLNSGRCCSYGSKDDTAYRFPASIAKLFWLAAYFGELNTGKSKGGISEDDLYKMVQNSDNEPASYVLDWLTETTSGEDLSRDKLEEWINKRGYVNRFFNNSGYQNVNVSQKNFPIPKLKYLKPFGRDLQMRRSQGNPLRNSLTTYDTARLLYEIYKGESVSVDASQRMKDLLLKDYEKEKQKEYDSIKGFIGEGLSPGEVKLFSKVGWTSDSRQDAAIIESLDGQTKYILVIFADDPTFANDWEFFPKASSIVYENMKR